MKLCSDLLQDLKTEPSVALDFQAVSELKIQGKLTAPILYSSYHKHYFISWEFFDGYHCTFSWHNSNTGIKPFTSSSQHKGRLLHLPLLEEIVAFVIHNNKCWEILHFHLPNGLHPWKQKKEMFPFFTYVSFSFSRAKVSCTWHDMISDCNILVEKPLKFGH